MSGDASSGKVEIDWAEARRLFEDEGRSFRQIAVAVGSNRNTVHQRSRSEQWIRDDSVVERAELDRRGRIQAAIDANAERWALQKSVEADQAGATAQVARQHIVVALEELDPQMTRAAAIAYGILIDKAQLLSGGATSRPDTVSEIREAAERLVDEVAAKRDERAAV